MFIDCKLTTLGRFYSTNLRNVTLLEAWSHVFTFCYITCQEKSTYVITTLHTAFIAQPVVEIRSLLEYYYSCGSNSIQFNSLFHTINNIYTEFIL